MDPGTIIGIGLAMGSLIISMILEGGNPASFIVPPAWILILGSTLGVTMASSGLHNVKKIPALYMRAIKGKNPDRLATISALVQMAERARKESLLALEDEASGIDDAFTQKGVRLIVDGTDPELVRDILDLEIESMASRHHENAALFTHAAGFAPTIGIIGTVMGLVHVLENLSDPKALGPLIASAFIATLLGVGTANLVYLPVANRLKEMSSQEADTRTMIIEGILAIQSGENPRLIEEKLKTFIEPGQRSALERRPAAE